MLRYLLCVTCCMYGRACVCVCACSGVLSTCKTCVRTWTCAWICTCTCAHTCTCTCPDVYICNKMLIYPRLYMWLHMCIVMRICNSLSLYFCLPKAHGPPATLQNQAWNGNVPWRRNTSQPLACARAGRNMQFKQALGIQVCK